MEYQMGVQSADDVLEKRKKKSAIRRKAIKFTKVVSLVGIRHATDARNSSPRRFVWVAWLVIGLGFAIYQIQDRIDYYFRYPTVTDYNVIISDTMLLPQVTICNDNQIVTSKSKTRGFYEYEKQLKNKMTNLEDAKKQVNNSEAKQDAETDLENFLGKFHNFSKNWKDLSKELTLSADEAIITVTFNETVDRSLIEELITDNGHCFTFSTKNRPLYSNRAGPSGGLFLVLSVARKEYEHGEDFKPGYRMLIHDSGEIPRMKESRLYLSPGVIFRVAVSLENTTQWGPPYGTCDIDLPDNNETNCLTKLEYNLFLKQCNCMTIEMEQRAELENDTSNAGVPICSHASYYNCTVININKNQIINPDTECKRECHRRYYEHSHTESAFPMLMNEVSDNVQGDSQILDRIRVFVYFEDLFYMQVNNEPEYLFLELLCDIGGALSLLLGATLLTVYEAGEFLLLFVRDYMHLRLFK